MVNWKKLAKRVPSKVQVGPKTFYEVLWTDEFSNVEHMGETRFTSKQIVIQRGHAPSLTLEIYLHELLHALSDEHDIGLTEEQVRAFETAFYYILKKNNVFKKAEE